MNFIMLGLSIALILYYIYVPHKNNHHSLYFKTIASISFLVVGYQAMQACSLTTYRYLVMAGLVFGALGDVALALAECYPDKEDGWFLAGLGLFLVGHLSYTAALFALELPMAVLFGVLSIIGGVLVIRVLERHGVAFDKMRIAATLYAIVILYMELCAISHFSLTWYGLILNIGTLCFVLSDLVLAFILFKKQNSKEMLWCNLTLYYTAQLCIAFTMWLC